MKLLPHQIIGRDYLAGRQGTTSGLFDKMGTGKTFTAQSAALLVEEMINAVPGIIIIVPPIAMNMWVETTMNVTGFHTQLLKTGTTEINEDAAVLVVSYAIAVKRVEELKAWGAHIVICDEAHALKNVTAKRTKAILGSGGLVSSVTKDDGWAWLLTGTPTTRWNDDLFPFLCHANPDGLKEKTGGLSFDKFTLRYTVTQMKRYSSYQKYATKTVVGNLRTEELGDVVYGGDSPAAISRSLAEVWEAMPPLTQTELPIGLSMTPELKDALGALRKIPADQIDALAKRQDPVLATIRRLIGEGKVKAFAQIVSELIEDGNGPVLIGGWHTSVLHGLKTLLPTFEILDGSTSAKKRTEIERAFNAGELDGIIGQISAMGVAINLQQGGNRVEVIESDWSPAIMDQFYARLYRMGQERHVHINTYRHDNQIDDALSRISATKAAEHAKLTGASDRNLDHLMETAS